jgi:hypothetical protein
MVIFFRDHLSEKLVSAYNLAMEVPSVFLQWQALVLLLLLMFLEFKELR